MADDIPADAATAFDEHESLTARDGAWTVTTTAFDGTVTARAVDGSVEYTVTVRAPTLDATTAGEVGEAVATDWLRTLRRRLEDAPGATRAAVDLDSFTVEADGRRVRVEYGFRWDDPGRGAEIAVAFAEFVEGTYVEGVVPGYEYEPPVADLLAAASQDGERGTPL